MKISKEARELAEKAMDEFYREPFDVRGLREERIAQLIQATLDEREKEVRELLERARCCLCLCHTAYKETIAEEIKTFLNKTDGEKS